MMFSLRCKCKACLRRSLWVRRCSATRRRSSLPAPLPDVKSTRREAAAICSSTDLLSIHGPYLHFTGEIRGCPAHFASSPSEPPRGLSMRVWQHLPFGIDSSELVTDWIYASGAGRCSLESGQFSTTATRMVKGLYNPKLRFPRIPCSDGAGEIMAVGPGVSSWKLGDRVAGIFMQNWIDGPPTREKVRGALGGDIDGMLAEHIVLSEKGLVAIPAHLTHEEASTLPCAAVTAWNALTAAHLKPGSTVLVQGTGTVSCLAQSARMMGARVLGISGSTGKKLERALCDRLRCGPQLSRDAWSGIAGAAGNRRRSVDLAVEVVVQVRCRVRSVRCGWRNHLVANGVLTGTPEEMPLMLSCISR